MRRKDNDLVSLPDRVLRMPLFTFLRPVPNDKTNFVNLNLYTALLGDKATTSTAHFIHTQIREWTTTKWGKPKRCPPSVRMKCDSGGPRQLIRDHGEGLVTRGGIITDLPPAGETHRHHHQRPSPDLWHSSEIVGTMEVGCWWSAGSMCYFCVW